MSMTASNGPHGGAPPETRHDAAHRRGPGIAGLGTGAITRKAAHALAATLVGFVLTLALKSWLAGPVPPPPPRFDPQANADLIKPVWTRIAKPVALFGLEAPEFDRLPRHYEARQHAAGGGREDTVSFGSFAGDQLYFTVTFYRPGEETVRGGSLFIETVRRMAENGLAVTKLAVPEPQPSKLGPFEVADGLLADGDGERNCLVFRHVESDGSLRVHGVACGNGNRAPDRAVLVCLIDRISLLASDDKVLRALFGKAEARRNEGCAASRPTVSRR